MYSPIHNNIKLQPKTVPPGIEVMSCPESGGQWISSAAYWKWRETLAEPIPNLDLGRPEGQDLAREDSAAGKRCPVDGAFLIRHRVGHGLDFYLDRCGMCGGVWLDAGEWEALQARGLHDDLHLIFSSAWQAEVRRQQRSEADERLLLKRLGEADLNKTKAIRRWIESHPEANLIQTILDGDFDSN
ncbi:MAG: zf-TFIIB domain-containing protein [Planctomycetota bacterium]